MLRWADVRPAPEVSPTLGPLAAVDRFKAFDLTKQKLVQMREAGSLVCVGMRDDADGAFENGWVLLQSGVGYGDHDNHGHW